MNLHAALFASLLFVSAAFASDPKTIPAARSAYEKADKELNKVYSEARNALAKPALDKLRDAQRRWIEYRDYMAERQAALGGDNAAGADSRDTLGFWLTRCDLTKTRIDHLRAVLGKGVPPGISGHYEDSFNGSIDLIAQDDKILFRIEVVRGPTLHTGEISGVAIRKNQTADFSDGGKDHDDKQPTTLRFEFDGNQFELTGKNTQMYHGARAYFDGHYLKYRALTNEETAALRKESAQ